MPLLIKKKHLEMVGYYPEGNIRKDSTDIFKPIIAKKGEALISGDVVLMEKLKQKGISISSMGQGKLRIVTHMDYREVMHSYVLETLEKLIL